MTNLRADVNASYAGHRCIISTAANYAKKHFEHCSSHEDLVNSSCTCMKLCNGTLHQGTSLHFNSKHQAHCELLPQQHLRKLVNFASDIAVLAGGSQRCPLLLSSIVSIGGQKSQTRTGQTDRWPHCSFASCNPRCRHQRKLKFRQAQYEHLCMPQFAALQTEIEDA